MIFITKTSTYEENLKVRNLELGKAFNGCDVVFCETKIMQIRERNIVKMRDDLGLHVLI